MPTFKNTSNSLFQDGDLIVAPGQSFSTDEQARIDQMCGQYAWQFDEVSGDAPTEVEVKETPAQVRPIASDSHVAIDEEGKQSEIVGSPEPAEKSEKSKSKK